MTRFQSRRSARRYPWHDYASPGAVFVTICVEERQRVFGRILDGQIQHSPAGIRAKQRWLTIPQRFPTVDLDAFVVMPDHVHGIMFTGVDPERSDPTATVGAVVRWFKAAILTDFRIGVRDQDWPPYQGKLWQDRFHDHIIRSDQDFEIHRRYIDGNPGRWWERNGSD